MRAADIAPEKADAALAHVAALLSRFGERPRDEVVELGALVVCAYPALARSLDKHPEDLLAVARGTRQARDLRAYRRLAAMAVGDFGDRGHVQRGLRRFVAREKLRIAVRELLAYPDHDVDVTARELSDLADASCEIALAEALFWAEARYGTPAASNGSRCGFVVIGLGKLGGRELNAWSDVDLALFYETDDGGVVGVSRPEGSHTIHEHFTRVAQRFVATLDDSTEDGVAWRVDLRLRPEGTRGPLVNALAAAERYYETWGRTWERAALVRARAVAGDLEFGARLLDVLGPFVWRRAVDPHVVDEMAALLARARAEAGPRSRDDLKIGPGGIREVEFFAQGLQLVWGGREPRVQCRNTIEALWRLRARGFVTEREESELVDAYFFLRRLEHRIQFATAQQTHSLPHDASLRDGIARSLGYEKTSALLAELDAVRSRVSARFASLGAVEAAFADPSLEALWEALDAQDESGVARASRFRAAGVDLPRHLVALARRPDGPLGAKTRDRHPLFAVRLVDALADAADPEQAARLLSSFFARLVTPDAYVRALADDPRLVRAMCSLFGASTFLGESAVAHPDLVDRVLFARGSPTQEFSAAWVDAEVFALSVDEACDVDAFVGALRRAKWRATFEIGLADLAGELAALDVAHALTKLADAVLAHAVRFTMRETAAQEGSAGVADAAKDARGLSVVAMGSFGGRELGYGSDLDLLFVYDAPTEAAAERFARIAQRVLRLMETPHHEGSGYALDTRLRPSGNQGLLVVSLEGFARYHEQRAETWERQALVKARACAGDLALGARVMEIAHRAAYERGAPDASRMRHLRTRMERELGHERLDRSPARYDLKVGRGGLVDVEFATQWLQMRFGEDRRVRTTETDVALSALETCGYLDSTTGETLRDGWRFLRKLEQRLRISHGSGATLIEEGAPGLPALARRMGMRDGPRAHADRALLDRYVTVTREIRAAYLRVIAGE
ncbi:MAG TPA: bifunctional [glutamate--ammonia ligase]-adenylyl-L-tyrosine phosphorylase/[glutamate--ammonia-ligase] adenylyltransferase [Polyangiaceae bacterium]|nr:bifunctional [glutamate--ammonia ligase]-adenylyl-L-tyrosine phosphorylase/[glutamate--ammonia-ligase] adenylyltransferase [Polyangiaceae bacterium]